MPPKSPNAAISFDQRSMVATALRHYAVCAGQGDCLPVFDPLEAVKLADRLDRPGPPLVSTADVYEVFELIAQLHRLQPGDELDHQWGFVRRVEDGFLLAYPGHVLAEGNWRSDDVLARAQEMYEAHLMRRDLLPNDDREDSSRTEAVKDLDVTPDGLRTAAKTIIMEGASGISISYCFVDPAVANALGEIFTAHCDHLLALADRYPPRAEAVNMFLQYLAEDPAFTDIKPIIEQAIAP